MDHHAPAADEPPSPALPQRRKLAFTLGVPFVAAIALILLLARNGGDGKPAAATAPPPAPENAPITAAPEQPNPAESVVEITSTAPPSLPEPLEIIQNNPHHALPDEPSFVSAPEPVPTPEAPSAPLMPDPEEGLVAAVPDTPGHPLPLPPVNDDDSAPGEKVVVFREQPLAPAPADDPAPQETPEPIKHTVVRGDNLTRLARQYGCEAADIMRLNGLKNDMIRLGQELLIPPPAN